MNWIILAVLAGLGSSAFSFFTRYLLKDNDDPTAFAWFYEALQFAIYSIIAIVIIRVLTAYVFVFALQRGNVSVVNGIYQGMLLVSVLTGILFLRERENIGKKIVGTIATLIGVLLLS